MHRLVASLRVVVALVVSFALLVLGAPAARACGGFMAPRQAPGQASAPDLKSDGSKVALVRNGLHTIVSLSMRYRGPPDDFALVVPVPVVLLREKVRTLHPDTFARLDEMSRPVLVEQWEEDPCRGEYQEESNADLKEGGTGARAKGEEGSAGNAEPAVKIEAAFSVDEYDIVILGASDSVALERWLVDAGYALPRGIEPFLRPYVATGSKFFVAKVDARKIELSWGRAVLSPIRFEYDSETFSLPIRLGLANVDGDQDLTVFAMGKGWRYEAANYANAVIPTNLRLVEGAKAAFPAFYEKLFLDTVTKHPSSFVTEYAKGLDSCASCRGMLQDLGADEEMVLTRLHARYGATFAADLVLRTAMPLSGGMESFGSGELPKEQSHEALENDFRARYFVRHPWREPIECAAPSYGSWTGSDTGSGTKVPVPESTPLDQWTYRADDAKSHARSSIVERFAHRFPSYEGTFVVPPLVALVLALGVLIWRARRLGVAWWRPSLALVGVAAAPALALLSRTTWHAVVQMPFPVVDAVAWVVAAAFVVAFATARVAGRPTSKGLEVALALAPVAVALANFRVMLDRLDGIVLANGDAQALRIYAEGEGEALEGLAITGCASALLLAIVAWPFGAAAEATPSGAKMGPGHWAAAFVVGAAANALAYATESDVGWLRWVIAAAFVFGLVVTSRPAVRGARALDLGAIWLLALMVLALAAIARMRGVALQATSGESIDPSQRAVILRAMDAATVRLAWRAPIAVLASVVAPLVLSLRSGGGLANVRWKGLAPVAVVLVGCTLAWWSTRVTVARLYAAQQPPLDMRALVDGVEPAPVELDERLRVDHRLEGPAFLATRAGALLASPDVKTPPGPFDDALWKRMAADTLADPADPLLAVDRDVTVAKLDGALSPILERRHTGFRWVLGRRRPAGTGTYGLIQAGPDDRVAVAVEWRRKLAIEPPREHADPDAAFVPDAIAVRVQADALEMVTMTGVHGRYRRSASAKLRRVPVTDPASFPFIETEDNAVVEIVIVATPELPASTLTAVMRAFMAVPPRDGWGLQPSPRWTASHPVLHFVVTTDASPFSP